MRLFVAVVPPADAVAHLRAAVDAVRRDDAALRWAGPEQWHLTLAFLGEVAEPAVAGLEGRFGRVAARHPSLHLRFAGAGRFGRRVLWVGVDGDRAELRGLAASVGAQARKAGIPVEDRPYRPHLTLARARDRAGADLTGPAAALTGYAGPPWQGDTLQLVRSHLGGGPARYETVAAWPLSGRD